MTTILGVSAFYHDSAAALMVDGEVVAAAQEERFSRIKHDEAFPANAVAWCLSQADLDPADLDYVGFYEKPYLKFERILESHIACAPRSFATFKRAMPVWLRQKLWTSRELNRHLDNAYTKKIIYAEHHESHAAGAFFPSPFEEAAILTFDGVGEWSTATWGIGRGNRIELSQTLQFPHSLGLLYTAFTTYAGFRANADEYKLMGLAPFGEPHYYELIVEKLVDLKPDGSFRIDMSYFDYVGGLRMTSDKFHASFGGPPRLPESPIEQRHMDIAASIQKLAEEIVLRAARHVATQTGLRQLCLSGGVALNCVANGRLQREGPFDQIWIQPAAGDAGSALGVASFIWHQLLDKPRHVKPSDSARGSLLGPIYSDEEIRRVLDERGAKYSHVADDEELTSRVAQRLAAGDVVGWFQGRMEFGPRALGSRSILGDPRRPEMQAVINQKVKFREGFRPFAPAVLQEHAHEYFALNSNEQSSLDRPYMLVVYPVREEQMRTLSVEDSMRQGMDRLDVNRSRIPAVTHVDGSARVQTVDLERHGLYRRLLEDFHRQTGCPMLVNTSFNLSWEPIVEDPAQAYATFMSSDIDALCLGHFILHKSDQRASIQVGESRTRQILGEVVACPSCRNDLHSDEGDGFVCPSCANRFRVEEGIARLYWPHESVGDGADVTDEVKAFYEETPFPNYDEHDSVRSLIDKSRSGGYAALLDRAIPHNSTVLEVGCGTGQLSNFLGVACRRVVGTDLCLNSLRLGESFRRRFELDRVQFVQMNLFRPALGLERFDVILCNGVLHHTSDPRAGFRGLVPLLKPGGVIVIGLYNRYGRLMTDLRRQVFRMIGGRARWIDPYLRSENLAPEKQRAWFADQYQHPHESEHTIDEVIDWFDDANVDLVRGVPALTLGAPPLMAETLFEAEPKGTRFDHLLSQLATLRSGNREGGFFLTIGRKPGG